MYLSGSLNFREINLILEELSLCGCRIQEIYQPESQQLVFEIYGKTKRFKILFVFRSQNTRFHILTVPFKKNSTPQRFVSFLRAHVRNGRINLCEQVFNERIVKMSVEKQNKTYLMWIRLWAGNPNLIVTDSRHVILDSLFRRPKRGEISGGYYNPEESLKKASCDEKQDRKFEIRDFPGNGSFNERVASYFLELETRELHGHLKKSILKDMESEENRSVTSLYNKKKILLECEDFERYRQLGDLITSSLHRIMPGDKWLECEDFYDKNRRVQVELKSEYSPSENAEYYYTLYRKAKGKYTRIKKEIGELEDCLGSLKQKKREIEEIQDVNILKDFRKKIKKSTSKEKPVHVPWLTFKSHGFILLVGRNATENERLLRSQVKGNDYWFHCRDNPGAYVFVKMQKGKSMPLPVMLDAAHCALFYSKAKKSEKGNVYYTRVKYLKKRKGMKTGLVIPTQEKNLFIKLDPEKINRLRENTESNTHL